jgi:hypothetical protein
MARACRDYDAPARNPGLVLGAVLGGAASGTPPRDKLTLVASPEVRGLLPWIEHLVAESTGKQGIGLLPLLDEDAETRAIAADQRMAVYLRMEGSADPSLDKEMETLAGQGHPVAVLHLADRYDVGAAIFCLEFATALAGKTLDVNPFDEPNVAEPLHETMAALAHYEPEPEADDEDAGETSPRPPQPRDLAPIADDEALRLSGPEPFRGEALTAALITFLKQAGAQDYVALLAFMDRNPDHAQALQALRRLISTRLDVPVTVGYGPRYLHSTGQLHKGGRENGLFLQLTYPCDEPIEIPGRAYGFGQLLAAQALGDRSVLARLDRPVMHVELLAGPESGLATLIERLEEAL